MYTADHALKDLKDMYNGYPDGELFDAAFARLHYYLWDMKNKEHIPELLRTK